MEIIGTLAGIKQEETKGQYQIREFLLDISSFNPRSGELFENMLVLSMFGEKCKMLDNFAQGDRVSVSFNLRGGKDKDTGKWKWVNVSPWKINACQEAKYAPPAQKTNLGPKTPPTYDRGSKASEPPSDKELLNEDLPF